MALAERLMNEEVDAEEEEEEGACSKEVGDLIRSVERGKEKVKTMFVHKPKTNEWEEFAFTLSPEGKIIRQDTSKDNDTTSA